MEKREALSVEELERFSKPDESFLTDLLEQERIRSGRKILVLDDDPTGIQTVQDVFVYTKWGEQEILNGFKDDRKACYFLTNSRSFSPDLTKRVHQEIGKRIARISKVQRIPYLLISRSDSTLRGHYPLETETLSESIEGEGGTCFDGEIICPYFREGGRFTINDVHYVKEGDQLVPASQTEFARDLTFGYKNSNLSAYVEERTLGGFRTDQIHSVSLTLLRNMDFDGITELLLKVKNFEKIVVNAVDDCDLTVFCICMYRAMNQGKEFICRTAASFVRVAAGIPKKPMLTRDQMITADSGTGGLVIVGSHTEKSTRQLEELKGLKGVELIPFHSELVLEEERMKLEIRRVLSVTEGLIRRNKIAVIYTNRSLMVAVHDSKEAALRRSVKISDAVQSIVAGLTASPAFIIAKGGITSSDIGVKALKVEKAYVLGQIKQGIPVWKTGAESKFSGIPYVIFPGNVGEPKTLKEVVEIFCL